MTIFFFVSGLLITGQLLDERHRSGRIDFRRFYWRRLLRLWPASTAFIVVAGCVYVALGGSMRPWAWSAAIFYLANYVELATHLFDTTVPGLPHPFVILWSLAIEEQFYLVWPLLLLVLAGVGGRAALVTALLCCVAGCLAWRMHLAPLCEASRAACGPHGDDWIGKSTDTRADSLAFGALAAVMARGALSAWLTDLLRRRAVTAVACLVLLATILVRDDGFRDTWRFTVQGLALSALVPASALAGHPLGEFLSHPVLVAVGRLSYGLYLWHWLALMLAARVAAGGIGFDAPFLSLTALFTLASWFAIERPIVAWRRRAGSNASPDLLRGTQRAARTETALAG